MGLRPSNFSIIERVRAKTYFGSGAHRLCKCISRSTGQPCKLPAVTGSKVCRPHGGTGMRNRWGKTVGKGCDAEKQYFASVVFSADLNDVVSNYPREVAKIEAIKTVGARGRALHALANGKHE